MNAAAPESDSRDDPAATSRSLLARLKGGRDDRAWGELVELYAPLVYFWCRRADVPEQDAADVVQDVFRAVVAGIGKFRRDRPSDTFRGWLRTITRNCATDYYRRRAHVPVAVGGTEAQRRAEQVVEGREREDDEEQRAEHALFRRALEAIRPQFDPTTWQAFWRVVVDGLSAAEAGAELGMRAGTVRVAKSRVLQRLRRHLGDVE